MSSEADQVQVQPESSIRIDVHKCPACDGLHANVMAMPYRQHGVYTHWFHCPTLGDPVPMLMQVGEGKLEDVNPEVTQALVEARKSGKYLVVVAIPSVDDPATVLLKRFTHEFPTRLFQAVWGGIRDDLDKEAGPPPVAEMPRAGAIPPAVNLFGPPKQRDVRFG